MEAITVFRAVDGKEFHDSDKCLKYECLIERMANIMRLLPPIPQDDSCDFVNGGGFIQHDKNTLNEVKLRILEICKEYIDHHWIQQSIDNLDVHPSWVGRLLSDYNIRPLELAWGRIYCIDNQYREWGQPYYANNPTQGKQIQINSL